MLRNNVNNHNFFLLVVVKNGVDYDIRNMFQSHNLLQHVPLDNTLYVLEIYLHTNISAAC